MSLPTFLVVEDDAEILEATCHDFRAAGLQVLGARNGIEALAIINKRPQLDALFTDIALGPGPDGWDVADAFRVFYKDKAVVYASAYSPAQVRRVPNSLYCPKPYRPSTVRGAISKLSLVLVPEAAPSV